MSDTIVLGDNEIRDYVARVRRALDDLRADDVDELTSGMEADLAEIRSEAGSLVARLGEPETYAAELRAAAGLPPRSAVASRTRGMREATATVRESYDAALQRHPWLRHSRDYVRTLHPAWWLLRAFLAVWCINAMLGLGQLASVLLLLAAVPLSVWIGWRGRGVPGAARLAIGLANTVAVVASLVFGAQLVERFYGSGSYLPAVYSQPAAPSGLSREGVEVANVFVYDEQGNPVPRARLFDEGGSPLIVRPHDVQDRIASVDSYGQAQRNVVPRSLPSTDAWHPTQEQLDAEEYAWRPPATLPPLLPVQPAPTATPSPGASSAAGSNPTSSLSATLGPSVTSSPSRTSGPSGGPTMTSGPSTAPTSTATAPTPTPTGTTTP